MLEINTLGTSLYVSFQRKLSWMIDFKTQRNQFPNTWHSSEKLKQGRNIQPSADEGRTKPHCRETVVVSMEVQGLSGRTSQRPMIQPCNSEFLSWQRIHSPGEPKVTRTHRDSVLPPGEMGSYQQSISECCTIRGWAGWDLKQETKENCSQWGEVGWKMKLLGRKTRESTAEWKEISLLAKLLSDNNIPKLPGLLLTYPIFMSWRLSLWNDIIYKECWGG